MLEEGPGYQVKANFLVLLKKKNLLLILTVKTLQIVHFPFLSKPSSGHCLFGEPASQLEAALSHPFTFACTIHNGLIF